MRLIDEQNRVKDINQRVHHCHVKIQQVKGSNKATTVFSTAKFPASKQLPKMPTLFSIQEDVCTL